MEKTVSAALAAIVSVIVIGLAAPASAATYGNEPHHVQMDRDHQKVAPLMNSENESLRACAHRASAELNGNDWHASLGYSNIVAWNRRKEIMAIFDRCVAAVRYEGLDLRSAYGTAEHQIQMLRDHHEVGEIINSDNEALRTCAQQASTQLNANDWHANLGYSNVAAWNKRKEIMINFRRCRTHAKEGRNVANNQALEVNGYCTWDFIYKPEQYSNGKSYFSGRMKRWRYHNLTRARCDEVKAECLRINDAWANWDPGNTGSQIHRAAADTNRNVTIQGYQRCLQEVERQAREEPEG